MEKYPNIEQGSLSSVSYYRIESFINNKIKLTYNHIRKYNEMEAEVLLS